MWTFIFFIAFGSYAAKKTSGSVSVPDFAFPKKVATDARMYLSKALDNNDGRAALQSLIQIVIADNLVSKENGQRGAALIDSVASQLNQPYSSLAYLLEARLYRDIYNSSSYLYNRRTIPVDPTPADISEWSRDMFSNRVRMLVEKGFKSVDIAKETDIAVLKGVVTNDEEAATAGLTVYDFMTIQGIANLQPFVGNEDDIIPFKNGEEKGSRAAERTTAKLISELLSENESWHEKKGLTRSAAEMDYFRLSTLPWSDRKKNIEQLVAKYQSTPYCGKYIIDLANCYQPSEKEDYHRVYQLAENYLKENHGSSEEKGLKALVKNMTAVWLRCQTPAQVLPGKEVSGEITFRNLSEFYLLAIKMNVKNPDSNVKINEVVNGKLSVYTRIELPDNEIEKPSYTNQKFNLPPLESGIYAIVASTTPDKTGIIRDNSSYASVPLIVVSRLSSFRTIDSKKTAGNNQKFYVVEGANERPVAGANVKFTPAWGNKNWTETSLITDKEGKVIVPKGSYKVAVKSGNDLLFSEVYESGSSPDSKETINGQLLTDLSIYHPGDTVAFTGVIYKNVDRNLEVKSDCYVKIILNDANYQPKDTLELKSDQYGRIDGKFPLPDEGLLGSWSIQMNDGKNYISQSHFEVADYKSPTFYVVTTGDNGEINIGTTIHVKGEVKTYSGMPIGDADIKYNVKYLPWRWGRMNSGGNATYGGAIKSNPDGSFEIELPTAGLIGTPYQRGRYQLNITATNGAGETQESQPLFFSLGSAYRILAEIPQYVKVGKNVALPDTKIAVYDMLDRPVIKKIFYKLIAESDSVIIASGEFDGGRFPYNFDSLKSGRYKCEFSLEKQDNSTSNRDEDEVIAESSFVIWRTDDKIPPVETALWVPESRIIVNSDNVRDGKVKIKIGSSYPDSYIYAEMEDMSGVFDCRWFPVSKGMIEVPVKSPSGQERVEINLIAMHDLIGQQSSVTLIPEIQTKRLEIKTESFRDRIVPGAKEEWKFRFSFDNKDLASLPVAAVMTNKALNALAPFEWSFDPYNSIYWSMPGRIEGSYIGTRTWSCQPGARSNINIKGFDLPEWNTYGYSLYSGGSFAGYGQVKIRGTRLMKESSNESIVADEAVFMTTDAAESPKMVSEMKMAYNSAATAGALKEEAGAIADDAGKGGMDGSATQNSTPDVLRETECPLAFFMPNLVTDNQGIATIGFNVPAYNGSWQLQVMGYTSDLRGAVLVRDAVASKPVMAQMNAPRFVRTGDLLTVSATIYNNTADATPISGKIVIFNPLNGETYTTVESGPEEVVAMGSTIVSARFRIPSNIETLGIRVYGSGPSSTDGEQTIIPVFPSSTPVLESETFYLTPGEEKMKLTIPSEREDGILTLSYTDNPVWECVTALPALASPDSENVIAQARALYGNAVASGLLKKYPQLIEALKLFSNPAYSSDSTLVSSLQKNASLKLVELNNTPWVRDAQSQTLRMQSLTGYIDADNCEKVISDNLKKIAALQNEDGGWSWCAGMQSSQWITTSVLNNMAMLHKFGFLPKAALNMSEKGIKYVDSKIVEEWRKIGSKKFSYISLLNYLYIRSSFEKVNSTSHFAEIKRTAISEIEKSWKKMGIYDKATAAILLKREGRDRVAHLILESLSQYCSSTKEKGVWYDNLRSDNNGKGILLTTARALQAFSEIEPKSDIVDGLRQWILLSKQTQDWGDGEAAATLVQAILDSGSDWIVPASDPKIYLNGTELPIDKLSALTGSLTFSLTGKSGELEIIRTASGPAWGGIVNQYVAPISEVEAASVAQLSVEKKLYTIGDSADGTVARRQTLKKGDRVRVTLIIKCDRDLQYVAVSDNRSASLEPEDQTSGYTSSDGVWYYREVRNSATNLFIPFLKKGTHLLTYDCFVDRDGEYSLGIAEAQSQYAPVISAHSAGDVIVVRAD